MDLTWQASGGNSGRNFHSQNPLGRLPNKSNRRYTALYDYSTQLQHTLTDHSTIPAFM